MSRLYGTCPTADGRFAVYGSYGRHFAKFDTQAEADAWFADNRHGPASSILERHPSFSGLEFLQRYAIGKAVFLIVSVGQEVVVARRESDGQ